MKITDILKNTSRDFLNKKEYQLGLLIFILLGFFFYLQMKKNKEKERKEKMLNLAFENLIGNLQLKSHVMASVENRKENIQKRISKDFWNDKKTLPSAIFGGSFGRGTAIRGRSDFDLLIEIPFEQFHRFSDYSGNGQSSFLQSVKNSILLTYPNTEIKADGQVVIAKFSDGIKFEIIPFFNNGFNFIYPDTNQGGTWQKCFTVSELNSFQKYVDLYGVKLIHLCQMTRAWKVKNNVPISGVLIDTLAIEFMKQWKDKFSIIPYWQYCFMFGYFMLYLTYQTYGKTNWNVEGGTLVLKRYGLFEVNAETTLKLMLDTVHDYVYLHDFKSTNEMLKNTFGIYYKYTLEEIINGTK